MTDSVSPRYLRLAGRGNARGIAYGSVTSLGRTTCGTGARRAALRDGCERAVGQVGWLCEAEVSWADPKRSG